MQKLQIEIKSTNSKKKQDTLDYAQNISFGG